MSSKGNFTQALRELTGFDEAPKKETVAKAEPEMVSTASARYAGHANHEREKIVYAGPKVNQYAGSTVELARVEENAGSHITSTMVVTGKVKTESDLFVEGVVYGNLVTSHDVSLKSLVVGDIKASNIYLNSARVKGNVKGSEKVNVGDKTIVVGDITAQNIVVRGKVKGDLKASDTTILEEAALVAGDITTGNILSSAGACLKGSITTSRAAEIDDETEFDLGVEEYEQ